MNKIEKLNALNKATEQELTIEYIEQNAIEFGLSVDEMLDLALENIEENL